MLTDIFVVMKKEWKELFLQRKGMLSGALNQVIIVLLLGVLMPWQSGKAWLTNPLLPLAWSWLPVMMVMSMTADAFAGERERHTLETLLASRLPDRAIVLGKLLAAVLYGWGMAEAGLLLGVVTVNLVNPGNGWDFYPPLVTLGCLVVPFLIAGLTASLGTLVSLRASSVRQAFQQLCIGLMVAVILPVIGMQSLPKTWQSGLGNFFSGMDTGMWFVLGATGVLLVDLALIISSLRLFKRGIVLVEV